MTIINMFKLINDLADHCLKNGADVSTMAQMNTLSAELHLKLLEVIDLLEKENNELKLKLPSLN